MNTRLTTSNRLRLAAIIALSLVVVAGLLLATPQGQTWAQSALRFFTRQESNLLLPPDPTQTATQPMALVDQSYQTPAPAVTATPSGCDSIAAAHCTIDEIQPQVSFPIVQLGKLPQDLYLRGAVLEGERVILVYACPSGCFFLLSQEPLNDATAPVEVGESAQVETVEIQTSHGAVQGEYVQGAYTGNGDSPIATWDSNNTNYMLRWEDTGILYMLQWLVPLEGEVSPKPDRALLVDLAENLSTDPPAALNLDQLTSPADASLAAGFSVAVPSFTPRGWELAFFSYDATTGFVCLNYTIEGTYDHPRLFVRQSVSAPLAYLQPVDPADPLALETVAVGGAQDGSGQYTQGSFIAPENACNGQNDFATTNEALQWQANGVGYEIYGSEDHISEHSITPMDLVRMAESITGVVTQPADELDPGHLWSLADMESYSGEHLLSPIILPEGYAFAVGMVNPGQTLSIYRSTNPTPADSMVSQPVVYLYQCQQVGSADDPCSKDLADIPGDFREEVQINGVSGIYAKGMLGSSPETNWQSQWFSDDLFYTQRLFWQANGTSFQLLVMWGEGIDKDQMITIAGSVQ